MKLKLTDEEFSLLTDLAVAGDWVINSCRVPEDVITSYQDMKIRLLSILAKRQKYKQVLGEQFYDTVQEKLQDYFDLYANQTMLDRLAACLAEYEYGEKMTLARTDREDEYRAAFAESGLKNITVNLTKQP